MLLTIVLFVVGLFIYINIMDVTTFLSNPSLEALDLFKRKELFTIIRKLELGVKLTSTNKVLKEQIILHFVNEGTFDEDCLNLVTPDVDDSQAKC